MSLEIAVNDRSMKVTPAAATTVIDTDFPLIAAADVAVWRKRASAWSLLTLGTDYGVSLLGNEAGARVTLSAGSQTGDIYAILGAKQQQRLTSFIEGQFRSADINDELANILVMLQEVRSLALRAVRVPAAEFNLATELSVGDGLLALTTAGGIELRDSTGSMFHVVTTTPLVGFGANSDVALVVNVADAKHGFVFSKASGAWTERGSIRGPAGSTVAGDYASFDNISVRGADIASAATLNLDAATGNLIDVTGTTGITNITLADGRERTVRFTGVLTLTHGANLVLPGAANITTAAGDFAVVRGYAAGVVRFVSYNKANGSAVVAPSGGAGGGDAAYIANLTLTASVAANALTIAVKTAAGSDPSVGDPIAVKFRSATAATGSLIAISLTAALSLTISNGSTLGTSNGVQFRAWIVLFNDGSTPRLGVVNCVSGRSVLALSDAELISATAEGGAGAADSAHVIYSSAAISAKAFRILGYLEYSPGLATAGAYNSAPTKLHLFGPGTPTPGRATGMIAQTIKVDTFTTTSSSLTDITGMSVAITPQSACNLVRVTGALNHATDTGGNAAMVALLRGSTNIGGGTPAGSRPSVVCGLPRVTDNNSQFAGAFSVLDAPASVSPQTYKCQVVVQSPGTYYMNRTFSDTDAAFIGRFASSLTAEEIMG